MCDGDNNCTECKYPEDADNYRILAQELATSLEFVIAERAFVHHNKNGWNWTKIENVLVSARKAKLEVKLLYEI